MGNDIELGRAWKKYYRVCKGLSLSHVILGSLEVCQNWLVKRKPCKILLQLNWLELIEGRKGGRERERGRKDGREKERNEVLFLSAILREEAVCYLQTKDNWVNLCQFEEQPLQTSVSDYAPHSWSMRAKPLTAVHSRLPPLSRRFSPFRPGSLPVVLQDCTPGIRGCSACTVCSLRGRQVVPSISPIILRGALVLPGYKSPHTIA